MLLKIFLIVLFSKLSIKFFLLFSEIFLMNNTIILNLHRMFILIGIGTKGNKY